jgi:hypothetical protein
LLRAGAAAIDLTPKESVFLFGYPHVARYSTGVHDPLQCTVLYMQSGHRQVLFLANDLIFVGKELAGEARRRIRERTGVPEEAIVITATHTHSGPGTVDYLSNAADPIVPKADPVYLDWVAGRMVEAACAGVATAVPAEFGLHVARANGVGGNRHDPCGPADPEVPVMVIRSLSTHVPLACMVVYAMHPTVLHENSTLVSGDFPHFTREYLRRHVLPSNCSVLYHNGASGNQSPRHTARANTMPEAQRLGERLGETITTAIPEITYQSEVHLVCRRTHLGLQPRQLPTVSEAEQLLRDTKERLERLRRERALQQLVRTAECDWFGAEETVALARAAADGRLLQTVRSCSPVEIQLIEIGPWKFVAWPGEFFVEYALAVKARSPNTHVITLANGELQGYIVTTEAAKQNVYEATNALFSPDNGPRVVEATLALIGQSSTTPGN